MVALLTQTVSLHIFSLFGFPPFSGFPAPPSAPDGLNDLNEPRLHSLCKSVRLWY